MAYIEYSITGRYYIDLDNYGVNNVEEAVELDKKALFNSVKDYSLDLLKISVEKPVIELRPHSE